MLKATYWASVPACKKNDYYILGTWNNPETLFFFKLKHLVTSLPKLP